MSAPSQGEAKLQSPRLYAGVNEGTAFLLGSAEWQLQQLLVPVLESHSEILQHCSRQVGQPVLCHAIVTVSIPGRRHRSAAMLACYLS
jgi:hypothetical protein